MPLPLDYLNEESDELQRLFARLSAHFGRPPRSAAHEVGRHDGTSLSVERKRIGYDLPGKLGRSPRTTPFTGSKAAVRSVPEGTLRTADSAKSAITSWSDALKAEVTTLFPNPFATDCLWSHEHRKLYITSVLWDLLFFYHITDPILDGIPVCSVQQFTLLPFQVWIGFS